jgi:uncharacterized damage-inducible protein DinB
MSTQAHFQTLFAYQAATYHKLLDSAESLVAEEYHQRQPYRIGSLHDILFHLLYWHHLWRVGLEGDQNHPGLTGEEFPTIAALRAGMQTEQQEWQRFLTTLSEADFETERMISGSSFVMWRVLQHLLLHSMQHHAEAAALLTAKGYSPGGLDFIWYTDA